MDSDGHIVEPPAVWEEYAEPGLRDLVIRVRALMMATSCASRVAPVRG
jgi:hypothetical protein